MNKRWSVAIPAVAMVAALAAQADAGGKGKVKRSAALDRNGTGVAYTEKFQHHQGIRRVLSLGALGRTMKVENTINADGVQTKIGRGHIRPRETVTHTTTAIPYGTRSDSAHHKRGAIMRWKNREKTSRVDEVTVGVNGAPDIIETTTHTRRFTWNPFSNKPGKVKETETADMEVDPATAQDRVSGTLEEYDGDENLRDQPVATGGYRAADTFSGKLTGFRQLDANGPQIRDTYTMKYGFWRAVAKTMTFGLFGDSLGKTVTVQHVQDAFGTSVQMTTPKETITRSTDIEDGRTVSRGTFRRDGFWSTKLEKDTLTIDDQKGVHVVEKQRTGDETTKKKITTTQFDDGARSVKTKSDGWFSWSKTKVRASSPRPGGGKNWMRSRKGKLLSWQYGRVDGKFAARFDMPWFNIGQTVFTVDEATGEVGVMDGVAEETGDEQYAAE